MILFPFRHSLTVKLSMQACMTSSQDMCVTGLWHAILHLCKAIGMLKENNTLILPFLDPWPMLSHFYSISVIY